MDLKAVGVVGVATGLTGASTLSPFLFPRCSLFNSHSYNIDSAKNIQKVKMKYVI